MNKIKNYWLGNGIFFLYKNQSKICWLIENYENIREILRGGLLLIQGFLILTQGSAF
jgi:hypothetical protein